MKEIDIRPANEADFDAMWPIFQTLVAGGDTYTFPADTTREECHAYWFGPGVQSFVAVMGSERLLGMYKLVANQQGHGSHVANASFMVDPAAQGVGVGRMLGVHCMEEARRAGYLAMQFNFVVSTNADAVHSWQKAGFRIVGRLPGAFRHPRLGYVDALVMFHDLTGETP